MAKRRMAELQEGETLVVISTAAGDPLPAAPGEPAELWERSLSVIRKTKPDYLVFASDWMGKLHADRKRLVDAIEAIEPYVGHIILLNQPPILPETASRAAIRNGTHPVFRESEESNSQRRRINEFLHNLQSTKITVLDVSLRFETSDGGVRFVDEQGRQLYQDAGHISGYGADRIRDLLEKAVGAP